MPSSSAGRLRRRTADAQFARPQVFAGAPAATWIFPPGAAGNEFGVFHFRRVFELDARPSSFVVYVSADNRYRLFVNGNQVSSGPQRSDLMHWRYETVDLAPHLRAGRNVLAALVWNWGAERPVAQFSRQTAFLLQGHSPREAAVNSGPEWTALRNGGYAPIPVDGAAGTGLLATVLGVRPAEPGFKSVRIAPHLGPLQRAEGRVPHPLGSLAVRLARTAGGGLRADIILPAGLEGVLEWRGKEIALRAGRQELSP